jgi:hypothetical protein
MPGPATDRIFITFNTAAADGTFESDPLDFSCLDANGNVITNRTVRGFGREFTGPITNDCTIYFFWTDISNTRANPTAATLTGVTLTFNPVPPNPVAIPFTGPLSTAGGVQASLTANVLSTSGSITQRGPTPEADAEFAAITAVGDPIPGPPRAFIVSANVAFTGRWEYTVTLNINANGVPVTVTHDPEMRVGEDPN